MSEHQLAALETYQGLHGHGVGQFAADEHQCRVGQKLKMSQVKINKAFYICLVEEGEINTNGHLSIQVTCICTRYSYLRK